MTSQTNSNQSADQDGSEAVREKVDSLTNEVGRRAKRGLKASRDTAVERVQQATSNYGASAAKAVRSGRDQMRRDGYSRSAKALDRAAIVLEEMAVEFRSQDLVSTGAELVSIAKRRPGVTLGLFAGAGILLAFSLSGRNQPKRSHRSENMPHPEIDPKNSTHGRRFKNS